MRIVPIYIVKGLVGGADKGTRYIPRDSPRDHVYSLRDQSVTLFAKFSIWMKWDQNSVYDQACKVCIDVLF